MRSILFDFPDDALDRAAWPSVLLSVLDEPVKSACELRIKAIDTLLDTRSMAKAMEASGLSDDTIRGTLRRCASVNPRDHKLNGYRACKPGWRTKQYELGSLDSEGTAGLFARLLTEYPGIQPKLEKRIQQRGESLRHSPKLHWTQLRRDLLEICREEGVPTDGYPFALKHHAIRTLSKWFVENLPRLGRRAIRARYGESAARNWDGDDGGSRFGGINCNLVLSIDEWTVDSASGVTLDSEVFALIERFKFFTARLEGLNAVLRCAAVLKSEPNKFDFLDFVESCIRPQPRSKLTIPGLEYPKGACWPSELSGMQWWIPDLISVDNAKIHISEAAQAALAKRFGCTVRYGVVKLPRARGPVENFHGFLAGCFRRLASGTGTGPDDPFKTDSERVAVRAGIEANHIIQVVDVLTAIFNTTPRMSLRALTAMEHINNWMKDEEPILRQIPPEDRELFTGDTVETTVKVWSDAKQGKSPVVRYRNAIYRGPKLRRSVDRTGQELRLAICAKQAHKAVLYLPDGTEFDRLEAAPPWHRQHTLSERDEVSRLVNEGKIERILTTSDPIDMMNTFYAARASANKKAGSGAARAKKAGEANGPKKPTPKKPQGTGEANSTTQHPTNTRDHSDVPDSA